MHSYKEKEKKHMINFSYLKDDMHSYKEKEKKHMINFLDLLVIYTNMSQDFNYFEYANPFEVTISCQTPPSLFKVTQ
jgi:hypothetical protein